MKKEHVDYFFELFEKSSIPKIFPEVHSLGNKESVLNPEYDKSIVENSDKIYSVFFIPDYLKPVLNSQIFKTKKINQFFKGYAIFLDGFANADAYIKHRFRSNAKGIRRRVKRLESCFQISYKTYFGTIEKDQYDSLMDCLYNMLVKRFEQRNDVSQSLLRWDHYVKMYYSLINEKKASLFVVMDNGVPIVVSLNHHFNERLFSSISSYDIDYSKFSLGSVEIYKKLDWCIANDHKSYEMGMGDLSYKREWCNHIYNFEHQIIYPKNSISAYIKAMIEYTKASCKEFVFKVAYVKYKKFKARRKKEGTHDILYTVSAIEEIQNDLPYHTEVDYTTQEYLFLRRLVFDFLYTSIENVSNVKVLKNQKSFLIIGNKKMQRVELNG